MADLPHIFIMFAPETKLNLNKNNNPYNHISAKE